MDNPNITMEEYIRLEEEKARRRGKVYNWETATYEEMMSWMNDGYCNGGNLPRTSIIENQLHYQDYEWYEALEDSELKDKALRNKAIIEGFIKDDDDESNYEQIRQWDIYTNYDDTYNTNHDDNEREGLCEIHKPPDSDAFSTYNLAHKRNMENLPSKY
ncbi:hypothetical protein Tco_0047912 [Tanacetum coccineum]